MNRTASGATSDFNLLSKSVIGIAVACAFLPARTTHFDFRHIAIEDGLTVSFPRSSPPLAALGDERLPIVLTEPALKPTPKPGATTLVAGQNSAWPKLAPIARSFELRQARILSHRQLQERRLARASARGVIRSNILEVARRTVVPIVKTASVLPTATRGFTTPWLKPKPAAVHLKSVATEKVILTKPKSSAVDSGNIYNSVSEVGREDDRVFEVAANSGAEASQAASSDTNHPAPRSIVLDDPLANPSGVAAAQAEVLARWPDASKTVTTSSTTSPSTSYTSASNDWLEKAWKVNPSKDSKPPTKGVPPHSPQQPQPKGAGSQESGQVASVTPAVMPAMNSQAIETLAMMSSQSSQNDLTTHEQLTTQNILDSQNALTTQSSQTTQKDIYQVSGQVELIGGLALTSDSKLTLQWKGMGQTRDALVDLSTGEYIIEVPTIAAGKVIGTVRDSSGATLGSGITDLNDLAEASDGQKLRGVKVSIESKESAVTGTLVSAYTIDKALVFAKGAEAYGPAGARDLAGARGEFKLSGISPHSTYLVDAYAPEHWGTRVISRGSARSQIPVFANKMMASFLSIIGESGAELGYGVIWGQVHRKGKSMAGVKVTVTDPTAVGPIYFNALRIPDKHLTETTDNGLFAFIKIKPGLHVVMSSSRGRELPSSVVSVSDGVVSYTEIQPKRLHLAGRVYDPSTGRAVAAQVSVIGTSSATQADGAGFNLSVPSSDPVVFVEARPQDPTYMPSRLATSRDQARGVQIMTVQKAWLEAQMEQVGLDKAQMAGAVLGVVDGPEFHVGLDGEPQYSEQNIIYFDSQGRADRSLTEASSGGSFMMVGLSPGLHTVVVTSANGEIITTRLIVSENGVLNVLPINLKP